MRRDRGKGVALLILLVVTALVYWRVLENDFVYWDDDIEIYANPHLKGVSPETLHWMFFEPGHVVRYQPLTWLTWAIIYDWFGRQPIGFHLASLVFHCLNTALVFLLIRKLLRLVQSEASGRRKEDYLLVCAGLGTLLWALHPLRVEAVAWVSAFLHCQALLFLLLAALCYLEAATRAQSGTPRKFIYWASVCSFALSLLSYPIGLGFVVVIVVLDFYPLRRLNGSWWCAAARRIWAEKLPYLAVACLVLGLTLVLRFNTSSQWWRPVTLAEFGPLSRIMQAAYIWIYYLWRPWVPLNLSPVYTTLVSFNPLSLPFLVSLALVPVLSGLLVWQRYRWPAALALWVCHLVWLVPVLGLTEHPHYANDRYSLVEGIFWSVLAAGVLARMWERQGARLAASLAALLTAAMLGTLSVRQIGIWKNSLTLFEYMIARLGNDPYRSDIYLRLGVVQEQVGRLDEALESFHQVLQIDPKDLVARRLMAEIYYQTGHFVEAREQYQAALEIAPDDARLRDGLGAVFSALGDWPRAIEQFARALQHDPNLCSANLNMGMAMTKQGKVQEAQFYLDRAKKLQGTGPKAAP